MDNNYPITVDQIHEATNGGLDIYTRYCDIPAGAENGKKKFKYRDSESTPSAHLSFKNGVYFLVDFGGKSYSPVSMVQDKFGLLFGEAIKKIASDFNLSPVYTIYKPEKDFSDTDLPEDHFDIKFKKYQSLTVLGRFVADIDDKTLEAYNFHEVESYEKVIISKKTNRKTLLKVVATADYPIFAYTPNPKEWAKLYEPKAIKNEHGFSSKHSYLGKKPARYVHGLQRLLDLVDVDYIKEIREKLRDNKLHKEVREEYESELDELLLDEVIVCSGGSDGLNLVSLGYHAIWFNSESEQISYEEYKTLCNISKRVYNLPDIDSSGVKYGKEVAQKNWNLESIWLPQEKMTKGGKDFRDWLNFYRNAEKHQIKHYFTNLKNGALKCKFFDKTKGRNGAESYKINISNLHYFLNVNNYYTYVVPHKNTDITNEEQVLFINIVGNIVDTVSPRKIRQFCENYLREKGEKLDVINLVKSSTLFNENNLLGMNAIELNFKNFDADNQYFFFNNQVVKISAEKIEFQKHGSAKNYTWRQSIVNHTILPEEQFFEYRKDDLGNDRVTILRKDCEYMNFLMNTSRMFWRKELEEPFKNEDEKKAYHEANRFNLNGDNLSEEEHIIQEKHFLSKCFALGYLTHRYKRKSFARSVYATDDTVKADTTESNGRSGKSVVFDGLDYLLKNRFFINGKDKNLQTNSHILQGLSEHNDYVLLEDIDRYLPMEFLYTWITSSVKVNPKQTGQYELNFLEMPKLAITSNFGVPNMDDSTRGRLLFISFSNYYHSKNEHFNEERKVSDDFGGRDLYADWDSEQWNRFFNFLFQCCQFYLQHRHQDIKAPQDNISINNLLAGMGDNFKEWADSYFHSENLNTKIPKKEVMKDYVSFVGGKSSKSPQAFRKALASYCVLKKYILDPESEKGKDGRIKVNVYCNIKNKNTTEECFYIKSDDVVKEDFSAAEITATNQAEMNFEETEVNTDDIPF